MSALERVSTRVACGEYIHELAKSDDRIIVVSADNVRSMGFFPMQREMPDRVVDVGIAEQNMMTVAAGLAAVGYIPVVATYATYTCMRALEELRTFIAYPNLNVKVVAGMSGISGSIEGVTHQGQEDIPIMRAMPNFVVTAPADIASTLAVADVLIRHRGPTYMGLARSPSRKVFGEDYRFSIGKGNVIREGGDITVISYGLMLSRALEAHDLLKKEGIGLRVIEMPCIKPLDRELVVRAARETGGIVTAEDRILNGALGSAVAEVLCEEYPCRMRRLGIADTFTESGPEDELFERYGLGAGAVADAARGLLSTGVGA